MNQEAVLRKKVSNPNKAQSPIKTHLSELQFRSSAELVVQYKIKREKLAAEQMEKVKKSQTAMVHKRKNLVNATLDATRKKDEGENQLNTPELNSYKRLKKVSGMSKMGGVKQLEMSSKQRSMHSAESINKQERSKLPVQKVITQSSSRGKLTTSNMIEKAQGEGEKQVKRKPIGSSTNLDEFLKKQRIHVDGKQPTIQPVSHEDLNTSPMSGKAQAVGGVLKRKPVVPSMTIGSFLKEQGIQVEEEEEEERQPNMQPVYDGNNVELDDEESEDDEFGEDDFDGNECDRY